MYLTTVPHVRIHVCIPREHCIFTRLSMIELVAWLIAMRLGHSVKRLGSLPTQERFSVS